MTCDVVAVLTACILVWDLDCNPGLGLDCSSGLGLVTLFWVGFGDPLLCCSGLGLVLLF